MSFVVFSSVALSVSLSTVLSSSSSVLSTVLLFEEFSEFPLNLIVELLLLFFSPDPIKKNNYCNDNNNN